MQNSMDKAIFMLRQGKAPGNNKILEELSVGINFLSDFWKEKYLDEYIAQGRSKIKFITGNAGSGKTHFLELFSSLSEKDGYIVSSFSAKNVWIHDFNEIYVEILNQVNIVDVLTKCCYKIIEELGFEQKEIPNDMSFVDYLGEQGLIDAITKREMRLLLNKMFLQNPLIDNNFALACSLLTGGMIGHPTLEEHNKELLMAWLGGKREAALPAVRRLGLSPSRLTKYNARHMLRSLVEIIKLAGYKGLVVTIDDLDVLVSSNNPENIKYTKLKREDAYESIRELIDEIDTLKNVMFLFAFDRKLIDNDNAGIKSYQALWMRIQNEVVGKRFNRFTDIADLDTLAEQNYDIDVILEMSSRLVEVMKTVGAGYKPIDESAAQTILSHNRFGQMSLPRQVLLATMGLNDSE